MNYKISDFILHKDFKISQRFLSACTRFQRVAGPQVAGDPSQTTPVQITHIFFMLCCCTQIGCVEQHKNEENVCKLY